MTSIKYQDVLTTKYHVPSLYQRDMVLQKYHWGQITNPYFVLGTYTGNKKRLSRGIAFLKEYRIEGQCTSPIIFRKIGFSMRSTSADPITV